MSIDIFIPYVSPKELLTSPFGAMTLLVAALFIACLVVAGQKPESNHIFLNRTTAFFTLTTYVFLVVGSLALPRSLLVLGSVLLLICYILRARLNRGRQASIG